MNTKTNDVQTIPVRLLTRQEALRLAEDKSDHTKRDVAVRNSTKDVFCSVFRDLRAGRVV